MKKLFISILLVLFASVSFAADIKPALIHTFGHEGGFQKMPGDSGNYVNGKLIGTKFGIAARSYPNEDVPDLKIERAAQIYNRDFWGTSKCGEWKSQIIANIYFDFAVNMGQGTAARIIQRAINYAGYPRKRIAVDGNIGAGTVKRLNEVDQDLLFVHLVGLGHNRYVQIVDANGKNEQFFDTWARRMKSNVQRSVHEYEARKRKP